MKVAIAVLVLSLVASCSDATQTNETRKDRKKIGMPNPASVKCVEDGHKLEIRTGKGGGQVGICIDKNGKECEEWAYFRGECELSETSPR